MRIIDETPDPKVEKKISCENCGVRIAYVPADTIVRRVTDYTGDGDDQRFLTCPKCQKEQHLGRA